MKEKTSQSYSLRWYTFQIFCWGTFRLLFTPVEFEFKARNSYGEIKAFHYIEPFSYYDDTRNASSIQNDKVSTVGRIEVLNLQGNVVTRLNSLEDLESLALSSGVYILRSQLTDGSVVIRKIIK